MTTGHSLTLSGAESCNSRHALAANGRSARSPKTRQTSAVAPVIAAKIRCAAINASPPLCPFPTSTRMRAPGWSPPCSHASRRIPSPTPAPAACIASHSFASAFGPLKRACSKAKASAQEKTGADSGYGKPLMADVKPPGAR